MYILAYVTGISRKCKRTRIRGTREELSAKADELSRFYPYRRYFVAPA